MCALKIPKADQTKVHRVWVRRHIDLWLDPTRPQLLTSNPVTHHPETRLRLYSGEETNPPVSEIPNMQLFVTRYSQVTCFGACAESCMASKGHTYAHQRLPSAASTSLWLSVASAVPPSSRDRAFPAAAARTWNCMSQHITSAISLPVFIARLKT